MENNTTILRAFKISKLILNLITKLIDIRCLVYILNLVINAFLKDLKIEYANNILTKEPKEDIP